MFNSVGEKYIKHTLFLMKTNVMCQSILSHIYIYIYIYMRQTGN